MRSALKVALAAGLSASSGVATAQFASVFDAPDPILPNIDTPLFSVDEQSGLVSNLDGPPRVVWKATVHVPGARWMRLRLADVVLAGMPDREDASYLRISSAVDGAVQFLNQRHVAQWGLTSAYFNGDMVTVEIIASAGTGDNHAAVVGAWADVGEIGVQSICGGTDDRVLSDDPRSARYLPAGCTAWLIDDSQHCFGSAGHCVSGSGVLEFNVPLSGAGGSIVHPPPEDQYAVDATSMQFTNGGVGNDWSYFGAFENSNTGLTPYEAQGSVSYVLATTAPSVQGQTIRITGYGTVSSPIDPRWNQVQKTHTGPYFRESGTTLQYQVDTTGGNSGSAVQNDTDGVVIGVHTHAGCSATNGNQGTSVEHTGWLNARSAPEGVCGEPPPPPDFDLFGASSTLGQVGSINLDTREFGVAATPGLTISGMAYDPARRAFYLCTASPSVLYRMDEDTYEFSTVGTIDALGVAIAGLAFDPHSRTLFGIDQLSGGLFAIDIDTAAAALIGATGSTGIGAIDFDADDGVLYGIDDTVVPSVLVIIDPTSGATSTVGSLGGLAVDCDGLAWRPRDGKLYTVSDPQDLIFEIDKATGAATQIGPLLGADLNGTYGLAAGFDNPPCVADLTGSNDPNDPGYGVPDGTVDADDFFYFLDLFASGDPDADLTGSSDPDSGSYGVPDGVIDADDFFYYLDRFSAGCA
ncbi:MAG: hypothetical protein H6811_03785 [Phycisphaeraceae bacterium]|nr:hypothetical protein [Phycisphaeraceae bacterium]